LLFFYIIKEQGEKQTPNIRCKARGDLGERSGGPFDSCEESPVVPTKKIASTFLCLLFFYIIRDRARNKLRISGAKHAAKIAETEKAL